MRQFLRRAALHQRGTCRHEHIKDHMITLCVRPLGNYAAIPPAEYVRTFQNVISDGEDTHAEPDISAIAASARFSLPPEPAELKVTYRGAFGPLKIEVDPEWIREMLPDCSPRSRRGRRLRKLLRLHEEHNALIWSGRQISGIGPLVEERKRIEEELEAAAKEARTLDASRPANASLQAAALLAVKFGAFYDHRETPAVLQALLDFAGAW